MDISLLAALITAIASIPAAIYATMQIIDRLGQSPPSFVPVSPQTGGVYVAQGVNVRIK